MMGALSTAEPGRGLFLSHGSPDTSTRGACGVFYNTFKAIALWIYNQLVLSHDAKAGTAHQGSLMLA
jgi:hypothetical protein